ncbi:(4Fe-4S)-binding protein [Pseudodesulfovibrio cashew]|uniref:(4Fe-4S)-binding protein n=1 Tax=Pseudodesulfovibrio cashew TaxID=2678688 RepID=A0A6I6J9I2_9BACT|nr:ATP-binding protein [Pseudodesulfovibrio cashew]QGY39466.1 (4Fe-4S)-binding protein [Pseudodesulfovibrio cashew]
MREIVIISGKGGAGKTTIAGAFAHLAENAILCDLDVDAPDLHLLLDPDKREESEFWSGHEAVIRAEDCVHCATCLNMCQFDAIEFSIEGYSVKPFRCEGCKVCVELCPAGAIDFPERKCGHWFVSDTRFGTMVHAQLFPGEENSGRLVTLLKQQARQRAEAGGLDLVLSDGTPGIGCPVIASLAGTDLAVVVTEPTPSGIHDLERVAELCEGFRTKVAVLVNKWDINPAMTEKIEAYCRDKGYTLLCRFPHNRAAVDSMLERKVLTEYDPGGLGTLLKQAWKDTLALLEK